jgi:hypothetical protein
VSIAVAVLPALITGTAAVVVAIITTRRRHDDQDK